MRRPLCVIGIVYVAAVWIMIFCRAGGGTVCDSLDREQIVAAGYVDWKEYRLSRGTRTPVIYLSDAIILKQSQVAVLEQFLSNSERIPKQNLSKFWKENKEKLQREDAVEIKGIVCYMNEEDMPKMGSLVMVKGSYRAFSHATNPGEFDAADYYGITGRQGRTTGSVLLAQSGGYNIFQEKIYRIREYLSLLIDACYDEEDASVMKAMLLGEKGTLDSELKELYRANGIIHILSISGLHLSILGMGLHKLLRRIRIPYVVDIILCIGLMFCYGTMTGMGTSMLRAYIMFVLHLFAGVIGRTYDLLTAVTVSALTVLLQQPMYLLNSGFLFSFGAVCGIGILLPAVEKNMLGQGRAEKAILSGAAVSLSTLPVYLCFYYEFPPYSILLNLIVIPCMTLLLLCGLASLGLAACFLALGEIAAGLVHFLLWFYEKCCGLCLRLPGHTWVTGCPSLWQVLLFFSILLVIVVWNDKMPKLLFWQGVLCAILILGIKLPQGLQITMVDVGQGDCIYLSEDGGIHILIDGGSSDKSDVAQYQMVPFLKYEGVSHLDAVVVTHPDSDHVSGICSILEEMASGRETAVSFAVDVLYLPDVGEEGRNKGYHELESLAARAGVLVRYIGSGDRLQCGKVMLTCLHPEKGWNTDDINAYSTVLHLAYGDFTALFTGDLEGAGEKRVEEIIREVNDSKVDGEEIASGKVLKYDFPKDLNLQKITLLKVAHHGSGNSTGEAFLRELDPEIALISSGRNNRYGHPHDELINRLKNQGCLIYGTQESGAVTVSVKGRKIKVQGYIQ